MFGWDCRVVGKENTFFCILSTGPTQDVIITTSKLMCFCSLYIYIVTGYTCRCSHTTEYHVHTVNHSKHCLILFSVSDHLGESDHLSRHYSFLRVQQGHERFRESFVSDLCKQMSCPQPSLLLLAVTLYEVTCSLRMKRDVHRWEKSSLIYFYRESRFCSRLVNNKWCKMTRAWYLSLLGKIFKFSLS